MKINKRYLTFFMAMLIFITSFPTGIFAYSGEPSFKIYDYDNIKNDKAHYINNEDVVVKEFETDPTNEKDANKQISDPLVDEKYTMRVEYYIDVNGFKIPKFQPYIASIFKNGKMDINKTVDLPIIDGYTAPTSSYTFSRDELYKYKNFNNGYVYTSTEKDIKVIHLFQSLNDPNVFEKKIETINRAKVGTKTTFYSLSNSETPGFSPEFSSLQVQIPESTENFQVVFRYLRDANTVTYNTSEGATKIRAKKLYYDQEIPGVAEPTKDGAVFLHWIANRDLLKNDGTTVKKGDRIKNEDIENLKMPSENLEFTAIWKEKEAAPYTILFYTEKSDYDDSASFKEKYDYVGSKKISDGTVGTSPDLSAVTPDGIKFPDIDLAVTSNPAELAKYFHRNEELTKEKNADEEGNQNKISSTGKSVFSIYYDREVYELVFEKAQANTFNPIITKNGVKYDATKNPYTIKARFNQDLGKLWPRDSEIEGWTKDYSGQGWLINHHPGSKWLYRDTPPYRLSASDFIDAVEPGGNFLSRPDVKIEPRQISLGIAQGKISINHPVHVDFFKEDFDGKLKLDPEMYYWKSDTTYTGYAFPAPELKGFTKPGNKAQTKINGSKDSNLAKINENRPGEPIEFVGLMNGKAQSTNGYLKLEYKRNKYNLTLHSKKGQEFKESVYYDMPLKDLDLDTKYVPERPDNIPDTYEFKGWALDPVGQNLVKDSAQTMPNYNYDLYDHWAEKDVTWKVTLDPNGGKFLGSGDKYILDVPNKEPENLIQKEVKIDYTAKGPVVELNEKPSREGYTFGGWELILFKKDKDDKLIPDTSYTDKYKAPLRYAENNPIVEDVYLRAIWIDNNRSSATAYHHFYDAQGNELKNEMKTVEFNDLFVGNYGSASAIYSNENWILREDMEHNEYYQTKLIDKDPEKNIFNFHYRRFRMRKYDINYIDQNNKNIVPPEKVENGKRDYDAVSYRDIPGYKLTSAPNVELLFEYNNKGDLTGIQGFGDGEIITDANSVSFKYEDIRVIKRKSREAATPDGYHRVIFKADEGGNVSLSTADQGVKEIIYDVIDGLEFKKLPTVNAFADDSGNYEFDEWNDERFLNNNTPIREDHTFTAKFVLKSIGNEKIVPKGSTPTAKDLIGNFDDLEKTGAQFSFTPVDTSTVGVKEVKVTIRYPSGKTSTVTAKVKVVPIVEEVTDPSADVPEYYTRVIFDATKDGKLNETDKNTKVYNVYKGTNWKRAKYEGLSIPSASYKDGTKSFDKWITIPEDAFVVNEPLTITASYVDVKTIIPYDPSEPISRPDKYVRLTFEGTNGVNLSNIKYYYIKKDAGIILGDQNIIKPEVSVETGYEFIGWDKEDTTPINSDIVVKAKANKLSDMIEVSFEFVSQDKRPLPDAVKEQKPMPTEKKVGEEFTPEYNFNEVKITDPNDQGTWRFVGWTPENLLVDKDKSKNVLIGTWEFISNEQVLVRYEYKFVDEKGNEISKPSDFKLPEPQGLKIYKSETAKVPTTPVENTKEKTDIATYTFLGWDPTDNQEDVKSDIIFVGTWKVEKLYKDKYYATSTVINKNYGENTTEDEIIDSIAIHGYPGDIANISFDILDKTKIPNGLQSGVFKIPVKVTYTDDNFEIVDVKVIVSDKENPDEPIVPIDPGYPSEPIIPIEPDYPDEPYKPWRPTWHEPTQITFIPVEPKVSTISKVEPKQLERHEAYISGYPDGTVRPNGEITRAEVAAIFARLAEKNTSGAFVDKFGDVKQGDWFTESIMKLTSKDIIKGYPDGTYKPNNDITRAEFATIASKYITDKKLATETFVDVPSNHWARDVISQVKAQGWISGYSDGTFKPDAPITRAEAVSIVNRMFNRHADRIFINEKSFELKNFKDLSSSHWAFYDIYEAANSHDYEKVTNDIERWNKISN